MNLGNITKLYKTSLQPRLKIEHGKTLSFQQDNNPRHTHNVKRPSGSTGTVSLFSNGLASLPKLIKKYMFGKSWKLNPEKDSLQIWEI